MSVNLSVHDILVSPIVTEKSVGVTSRSDKYRKYTFVIHQHADKDMVKKAVESIFDVEVIKVSIRNMPGKTKLFRRQFKGFRAGIKKAEVTVSAAITGVDYGLGDAYGA